ADRPPLAGGVPPFEDDDDALPFLLDPVLQLAELRLELAQLLFIVLVLELLGSFRLLVLGHREPCWSRRRKISLPRALCRRRPGFVRGTISQRRGFLHAGGVARGGPEPRGDRSRHQGGPSGSRDSSLAGGESGAAGSRLLLQRQNS